MKKNIAAFGPVINISTYKALKSKILYVIDTNNWKTNTQASGKSIRVSEMTNDSAECRN